MIQTCEERLDQRRTNRREKAKDSDLRGRDSPWKRQWCRPAKKRFALNKECLDVSSHNLFNQTSSSFLFFRLSRRSTKSTCDIHSWQINTIIKIIDDFSKLLQQKLDERIAIYIFFFSEIILDPSQSLTYPNEIVLTVCWIIIDRVEDCLHLMINLFVSCELIEGKQVFFKI